MSNIFNDPNFGIQGRMALRDEINNALPLDPVTDRPTGPSTEPPTGPAIPPGVYNPVTPSTPTVLPVGNAAADELKAVLRRYGLEGLFESLNQAVMADTTLVRNADALFGSIRETPIYKERFKGNAERVRKGLPELSEAEYINQ
jgi:hypothetical protein